MTNDFSLLNTSASLPLYAIIVAGGSGSRMQSSSPKQFIPVGGLPILMHTIRQFQSFSPTPSIILVLPQKDLSTWQDLCQRYTFNIPLRIVPGGASRFQSVKNGLDAITEKQGLVAIHDGVRPFVSPETIRKSFEVAQIKGCAVAAVPLKDSIRKVNDTGENEALDRNQFRLIQTPQTFQLSVIKQSFLTPESLDFTDDASVAEKAGFPITLIEGAYENIKITTTEDLIWAEAWLEKGNK